MYDIDVSKLERDHHAIEAAVQLAGQRALDPSAGDGTAEYHHHVEHHLASAGCVALHRFALTGLELVVHLLSDCADSSSHLACSADLGDDQLIYDVATVPAQPILVVVRGQTPQQEGTFTLNASFKVAVCGDADVGGPKVCDDGNTTSGDGCSADCLTVEWPEVCAALPMLPTSETSGTAIGGPDIYALDFICAFDPQAARAFSSTAPSDGTLHITMEQPDERLSVYVQDGCGPVTGDDFVACGNSAFAGRTNEVDVILSEDQVVTVIVAGFDSAGGAFTLSSSFE